MDFVSLKTVFGEMAEEMKEPVKSVTQESEDTPTEDNSWRYEYLLGDKYKTYRFDKDNLHNGVVTDICKRYVDNIKLMRSRNAGIRFHGTVGSGKTFYAACIANGLIEKKLSIMMGTIPYLVQQLQKDPSDWKWNFACKCPVMIIDDFGIERSTDYMNEKITELIDSRYMLTNSTTIITTNLTSDALNNPENVEQERIYSRIKALCPFVINLAGEDLRAKEVASVKEEFLPILKG